MAQSKFSEVLALATSWANQTDKILLAELQRLNVGITQELFKSVQGQVYQKAGDIIQYDLSFLQRGRFRDMGAGMASKVESIDSNRDIIRKRKPAKWFSRPFYGRLNALQGAIGFKVMEQSIEAVITNLSDGLKGR